MPFQKVYDADQPITQPACALLRSKAMLVAGTRLAQDQGEDTGSRYCWCNLTQHTMGPDDQLAGRRACVPGRDCYRETV